MIPEKTPIIAGPDIKIDKPGGEGGTSGIASESAEFASIEAEGISRNVKIDRPGGEGGTNG